MRVAVTGATGNVGTSVVERLLGEPTVDEVVAIARRRPDEVPERVRFHTADVAEDDLAPTFAGVDVVIHLAWLFQPTHRPLVTWRTNALGSIRVFDAAIEAGVEGLVHASSVGAYSPGVGEVVDESWPTDSTPTAAYGREKAYVERVLDRLEAAHPELRVVRMRPAFIFQGRAATSQRRIFAGPLVPNVLGRRGLLPILPVPAGLRFQALHTSDVADAYVRAASLDVRGAFNLAADPPIDAAVLGDVLGARPVTVPATAVRGALAAAWHAHLVPAAPELLDLVLSRPLLDAGRARRELGWTPAWTGPDALRTFLTGLHGGIGGPSEPLAADDAAHRLHEVATGAGERP